MIKYTYAQEDLRLPRMIRVNQNFVHQEIFNLNDLIKSEFQKNEIARTIKSGYKVAIAVGSRGIPQIVDLITCLASEIRKKGGIPFIVPAMGSHGGATADGQRLLLESYGVSEASLGIPVKSSMETVELGKLYGNVPVFFDRVAFEADAIIPINKVALHTAYRGEVESGLTKMLCIGLGKHLGAKTLHRQGMGTFPNLMVDAGELIIKKAPVAFGFAVLLNAYDKIAKVEAVPAQNFIKKDSDLLIEASKIMAKILIPEFEILIVDRIGKDLSGEGMDPNVIRRFLSMGISIKGEPQKIVVLDLTEKTSGNAIGIGMADITTRRLVNKIDYESTYTNTITTTILPLARIPVICESDRDAIKLAASTCTGTYALDFHDLRPKMKGRLSSNENQQL